MPPEADCVALIMAGGRSARMRVTAGPLHKALVPVGGIPLIERNTRSLLSEGFQQIVVAVSIHEPAIGEFVEARCSALASHHGATVRVLWETTALGTNPQC